MIRKVLIAFLLTFLAANVSGQQQQDWVDSVYQSLTLDQRLGQLFIFPTYGKSNDQHLEVVKNITDRYTLGGVKFKDGTPKSIVNKVMELNKRSDLPLFTALQIEHIGSNDFSEMPVLPRNIQIGALSNDSLTTLLASETSLILQKMGINMAWSSGLALSGSDYNQNAFSSNADLTIEKWKIWNQGFKEVKLVASNYPGIYSNTTSKNKKELQSENIRTYQFAANNGLSFITIPPYKTTLDSKNITSLSEQSVQNLRNEFNGLIIAESFNDYPKYKPGKTEALAIIAGNDMVVSANISAAIKQLKKNIRKRKLSLADIESKVKKVLYAKYDLEQPSINDENIHLKVNNARFGALIDQMHKQSVTVIDRTEVLPIKTLDDQTFVSLADSRNQFTRYLDNYAYFTHYTWPEDLEALRKKFSYYHTVVIHLKNQPTLSQIAFINALTQKNIIVVSTSNPKHLAGLRPSITKIFTYQEDHELDNIAAQIIFGGLAVNGKMPLDISSNISLGTGREISPIKRLSFATPYEVQMDHQLIDKIDDIAFEAVSSKATPGGQIVVARKGKVVYHKAFGHYTYDSIRPVTKSTIYDIASITKVAATTQVVMFMHERGLIDLDKKISVYLPELNETNKENMTIRDILTHQAGLWPYLPFWKQTLEDSLHYETYYKSEPADEYRYQISDGMYTSELTRDSVWQWVKDSKLRKKNPRVPYDYKYSDMGYYMLQRMIENKLNQPMEEFLQQNFYDPMGLNSLSYLPLCKLPLSLIAPTEYDNYFRKTLVYGLVHDQGAAMMGGVAGHAGLFSNALDLAKLMQMNLWDGEYGDQSYFMNGTVGEFTKVQYESNRRGVGWDKPVVAEMNSPTSPYASKKAFGHSGFTGTAVWVDPEFDLIYVFLSNRIYPNASNTKLIKNNIRTRIQDLIYQSIFSFEAQGNGQ